MPGELLTASQAAQRLGVSASTFYDWLGQSDHGLLMIRGECVTVNYLQGGPKGQGRIRIEADEVQRLKELMRVRPQQPLLRRRPAPRTAYPGISVPLGTPPN